MFVTLKQRLAAGESVRVYAAGRLVLPAVFDAYGLVGGFHGVWLDQEHAGVTYEQVALGAVAARANGMDLFVRMPLSGYAAATQHLEAGAGGVMAARVEQVQEAEEFVRWVKFPPRGRRGVNTGGRDALYGGLPIPEFMARANAANFVAIQIETLPALERAAEIAALDGVDLLFIGPSDLSTELGVPGQSHSPELWRAIERVADGCRRAGKPWGTIAVDPAYARRAAETGCRMLSFGMDIVALRRGIEAIKHSFAEFFRD